MSSPTVSKSSSSPISDLASSSKIDQLIQELKTACLKKDEENGKPVSLILRVATLALAVFTGLMIGGWVGLCTGILAIGALAPALQALFDQFRNREYNEIAYELSAPAFQEYIENNKKNVTFGSLPNVYEAFKRGIAS